MTSLGFPGLSSQSVSGCFGAVRPENPETDWDHKPGRLPRVVIPFRFRIVWRFSARNPQDRLGCQAQGCHPSPFRGFLALFAWPNPRPLARPSPKAPGQGPRQRPPPQAPGQGPPPQAHWPNPRPLARPSPKALGQGPLPRPLAKAPWPRPPPKATGRGPPPKPLAKALRGPWPRPFPKAPGQGPSPRPLAKALPQGPWPRPSPQAPMLVQPRSNNSGHFAAQAFAFPFLNQSIAVSVIKCARHIK